MQEKCDNRIKWDQPWTDHEFKGNSALWKIEEHRRKEMAKTHDRWS
jgi:hypothetical protein